jgi:hypothetical protein
VIAETTPAADIPGARFLLYGSFYDVELVFVHVNPCECPRPIRVVRELQLVSFDHVDDMPIKKRHFRIPLHELP